MIVGSLQAFSILASRFAPTVSIIHTVMEIQLVIMLVLHATLWPYQKNVHNIVNTLLLANLAAIMKLDMMIRNDADVINVFIIYLFKSALVSIPMVVFISYFTYRIMQRLRVKCRRKKEQQRNTVIMDDLLLEDNVRDVSVITASDSYMLMR